MKTSSERRRLAGIPAVAALTAACTALHAGASPAAASPRAVPTLACTTLPIATPGGGTSGQRARQDMAPVLGGLGDIATRSSSSAWAVGSSMRTPSPERALVAHWNGAVWRTLSSRALPPSSWLGALALFPGGAWAVGESGMAEHGRVSRELIVRLAGTTVQRVQVLGSAESSLGDVAATSAADAWAVGATFNIPLILHWNGTAWTRAPLPATVGSGAFAGVAATSRTNAWAVMDPDVWGNRPQIVHWNGRRWGDVVSPAIGMSYELLDVAATSATNAWAVGTTGSAAVILHWNGRGWTCALSPKTARDFPRLLAVSASSADNAWAVGLSLTGTLALRWNGRTWKQVMTPRPGLDWSLHGVAIIPRSGHAWAVGQTTDRRTLMLYWNGTAWH